MKVTDTPFFMELGQSGFKEIQLAGIERHESSTTQPTMWFGFKENPN
jgi:hypothetical protein